MFVCFHRGCYKYKVMPLTLAYVPGIFQELMSIVLYNIEEFVKAYLYDIIILSANNRTTQIIILS